MSRHNTPISDRRDDDTAQTLNLSALQAARCEQDLKLQAVSLEDAGALAKFGDARVPTSPR